MERNMQGRKVSKFLRYPLCRAVVVSKKPLLCEGVRVLMKNESSQATLSNLSSLALLTPERLEKMDVVLTELSGGLVEFNEVCRIVNPLQSQFNYIRWIFIVPTYLIDAAIERLFRAHTSLLSVREPIDNFLNCMFNGGLGPGSMSSELLSEKLTAEAPVGEYEFQLTFAERRVMRLLSKGWRINQIAALLNRNNKTVSAQKNSAMRRLALKNDAEMYAWMVSERGGRELSSSALTTECADGLEMQLPQRECDLQQA
jgi:DNA-binding NarL/FixJ family response regulator